MNARRMFLSLVPWLLFSIVVNRHGANAASDATLTATALALFFLVRDARNGPVKAIDVVGVATFGLLTIACFIAGPGTSAWVADCGRGTAAAVLAVVMLGSAVTVPFTEQYARDYVPREFWSSPQFRSVNRRISAAWGLVIAVMAGGHLLAGYLDPVTAPSSGARPVDIFLNWVLPALLILGAVRYTNSITVDDNGPVDLASRTPRRVSR